MKIDYEQWANEHLMWNGRSTQWGAYMFASVCKCHGTTYTAVSNDLIAAIKIVRRKYNKTH